MSQRETSTFYSVSLTHHQKDGGDQTLCKVNFDKSCLGSTRMLGFVFGDSPSSPGTSGVPPKKKPFFFTSFQSSSGDRPLFGNRFPRSGRFLVMPKRSSPVPALPLKMEPAFPLKMEPAFPLKMEPAFPFSMEKEKLEPFAAPQNSPLIAKEELSKSPSLPLMTAGLSAKQRGSALSDKQHQQRLKRKGQEELLSLRGDVAQEVKRLFLEKLPFSIRQSVENSRPTLEVRKKRIARNVRLIPSVVRKKRGVRLALRPLIGGAQKKGKSFSQSFSLELLESFHGKGVGRETRDAVHKNAEGNRSFLRFRWW